MYSLVPDQCTPQLKDDEVENKTQQANSLRFRSNEMSLMETISLNIEHETNSIIKVVAKISVKIMIDQ